MSRTPGAVNAGLFAPPPPSPGCMVSTYSTWPVGCTSFRLWCDPVGQHELRVGQHIALLHERAGLPIHDYDLSQLLPGTTVGTIVFDVSDLMNAAPTGATDTSTTARSVAEGNVSRREEALALAACQGNVVDVTSTVTAVDALPSGSVSCYRATFPSLNMGPAYGPAPLGGVRVHGLRNQNVGSAIQSAFAWTMPQATMP